MNMGERSCDSKVRARIWWGLWILFVVAWSIALLTPHPAEIANAVFVDADDRFVAAKSLHVAAYFVLTFLTFQLPAPRPLRLLLLLFPSLHALATEGLQNFVPRRSGSWHDVGFDHIGIGLGFAAVGIWSWRRATSSKSRATATVDGSESREEIGVKRARSASKGGPC
jgi:VanZ family protein